MPRGRRSSPVSARAPSPPAARPAPPPPPPVVHQQPPQAVFVPAQQGRQPGMFAQMASTAAGVAVGSTVGHVVGNALFGGRGGNDQPAQQQPAPVQQQQQQVPTNQYGGAMNQDSLRGGQCGFELEQFLRCANSQSDLTLCSGFNDALRECKERSGTQG
jgi:hypothetical protein